MSGYFVDRRPVDFEECLKNHGVIDCFKVVCGVFVRGASVVALEMDNDALKD